MRPTKAIINLRAIKHNLSVVKQLAPNSKVMAVIKADAYGHGLVPIAQALGQADALAVACLDEAIKLRQAGIITPILLLEGFFERDELQQIQALNLETVIHQQQQLDEIISFSKEFPKSKKIKVWLKLDTGMNRLGFDFKNYSVAYRTLKACHLIASINLMSHLACADDINNPMNQQQIRSFKDSSLGLSGEKSMANSAGIIAWPECHFDWVRPGIALFGCSPMLGFEGPAHKLKAVMTLKSQLFAIRDVSAGDGVGYGASWRASQDTQIGIVAIGYGDGYPRHAAEGTPVWINGKTFPLIGKVSMDMLAVDLGNANDIQVGQDVILWGEGLPVEQVAGHADTIGYTLLCGVTSRVSYEWHDD